MSDDFLVGVSMVAGSASRYIKPRWVERDSLSTEAFDLRDGNPPETYVSHFLANGASLQEIFNEAHKLISEKIDRCHKGSIAILEISEALLEVNDEDKPFIDFIEKGLPHCGLVYLTADQQDIQEAKATLCLLAQRRLTTVECVLSTPQSPAAAVPSRRRLPSRES